MMLRTRSSWQVMRASLCALVIRNIQKRYIKSASSDRSTAFLWIFLEPMMHVGVWIVIRTFYGIKITAMNSALFILLGTIPFLLVLKCIPQFMNAVQSNKKLLNFRQVRSFDFVLSILIAEFLVLICALVILLLLFKMLGLPWKLYNPQKLIGATIYLFVICLGVGLFLSVLGFFLPFIKNFTLIFTRLLYLTSGVFFPANSVPQKVREILVWNPLFQIIELMREGFMALPTHMEFINHNYLMAFSMFVLFVGLASYWKFSQLIMVRIEQQ